MTMLMQRGQISYSASPNYTSSCPHSNQCCILQVTPQFVPGHPCPPPPVPERVVWEGYVRAFVQADPHKRWAVEKMGQEGTG